MDDVKNQLVKSKKDITIERMKGKYPDANFEDEEVLYSRINDDYDAFDKEIGAYKEREKTLTDMFTADPRSANFLMNWRGGGDPIVEMIRMLGVEGLQDALEDPQRMDEIAEANKEYLERVAKSNAFEEEYKKNLAVSLDKIEKMQGDDEEIDNAVTWLIKVGRDASMGIVNPDDVEMAIKALTFEKATSEAEHVGEVRGRNANIEEKLKMKAKGDGTAHLDGRPKQAERRMPNLGALNNIGESIWDRGKRE